MGINFPAVAASAVVAPLAGIFNLTCRGQDYFMHACTFLFVPVLWYLIGRCAEGEVSVRFGRGRLKVISAWLFLATFMVMAILISFSLVRSPEFPVLQALALAWFLAASIWLVRLIGLRGAPATR